MPIRILDAATVGRISAGEVVERPSSVVKELVENSIDAGATSVTVEIRGGGIEYLRVTDNGCGIEPGQVKLAFENHATSKLQNAEQLDDIRTMGFRGEALPSIAAVSKIEMTTHAAGLENGVRYTSEGGKDIRITETGCPKGTTLVMRDLFFNVPVRRTFLKKPSYEGSLVSDAVARLLLGNPGVSMRFISGGNTLYHSFGDGKLRNAVFAVYGRETAERMTEIDASEGGTRIYGLIGTGELGKQTRAHQMFFINGRSVRCPMLTKALEQVCRSRVTIGMYPMCVLNLVVPAASVDVNVHPNKLEVRFRDETVMRDTCERLLQRAFEGERLLDMEKLTQQPQEVEKKTRFTQLSPATNVSPAVDNTPKPKMPPIPGLNTPVPHVMKSQLPVEEMKPIPMEKTVTALKEVHPLQDDSLQDRPLRTVNMGKKEAELNPVPPIFTDPEPVQTTIADIAPKQVEKAATEFRVVGVLFKTYIIIECGDTMLMIDQHAAHERIRYEKLLASIESGSASQQLLTPIVINVSPRELAVVMDNLDQLQQAGYSVEAFGDRDIRISAVPFVMGRAEVRPLFLEMLESLTRLKSATVDVRRSEIMQMACKGAVKGGDSLSDAEIAALIREMQETGAPATCPHGRPVVKTFTRREIEKMFKRIQ